MTTGRAIGNVVTVALTIGAVYVLIGVKQLLDVCPNIAGFKIGDFDDGSGNTITGASALVRFIKKQPVFMSMEIDMTLKNPSYLTVGITKYDMNVLINDTPVANSTVTTPISIKSNAVSPIKIPIRVDMLSTLKSTTNKDLLNNIINQNFAKVKLSISGKLYATMIGIPIHKNLTIDMTLQDIYDSMNDPTPSTPC